MSSPWLVLLTAAAFTASPDLAPVISPATPTSESPLISAGFGILMQLDGRASTLSDGFTAGLRRLRLPVHIRLGDRGSVHLIPDFRDGRLTVFDAHADLHIAHQMSLRVGKWRSPVSLSRLQVGPALLGLERGPSSQLGPVRDFGAVLMGRAGPVEYHFGILEGAQDNGNIDLGVDACKEFAGRFAAGIGPLTLGMTGSSGCARERAPKDFRTSSGAPIFEHAPGTTFNGGTSRIGGHFLLEWDRLLAFAEIISSQSTLTTIDANAGGSKSVRHLAWQVSAAIPLTDDRSRFAGLHPTRPLSLDRGEIGAVELALTWGQLHLDPVAVTAFGIDDTPVRVARTAQVALNWYLDDAFRVQLNWDHTFFDGARPADDMVGIRLQANLSSRTTR